MQTDNAANSKASDRRENFRIDDLLATSVQKITTGVAPMARIIPLALSGTGKLGSSLSFFPHDAASSFAMLLLEANTKLDSLFEFYKLPGGNGEDESTSSMGQLLLQINAKLDSLLDFHRIARQPEATRAGEVSLSAGGIKLVTGDFFETGDLVEVHMLLSTDQPCWIVVGGSVAWATPLPEGGFQVAIRFIMINAAIQDAIATYALRKQKEQLINLRGLES